MKIYPKIWGNHSSFFWWCKYNSNHCRITSDLL